METKTTVERLMALGMIPACTINKVEYALPLAKALQDGGLPVIGVRYESDAAIEAIRMIRKQYPDFLIGAGKIDSIENAAKAIDAGVDFLTSMQFDVDVLNYVRSRGVLMIPTVRDNNEVESAKQMDIRYVEFVPKMLPMWNDLLTSFDSEHPLMFMATGELSTENMYSFLKFPQIFAVKNFDISSTHLLESGNYDTITRNAKLAVEQMLGITLKHFGINAEEGKDALIARQFADIFLGNIRKTAKGYYGSEHIEIFDSTHHKGTLGHIGIGVSNLERAIAYYEAIGYTFDRNAVAYDNAGNLRLIYFTEEIAGFAIHLCIN